MKRPQAKLALSILNKCAKQILKSTEYDVLLNVNDMVEDLKKVSRDSGSLVTYIKSNMNDYLCETIHGLTPSTVIENYITTHSSSNRERELLDSLATCVKSLHRLANDYDSILEETNEYAMKRFLSFLTSMCLG